MRMSIRKKYGESGACIFSPFHAGVHVFRNNLSESNRPLEPPDELTCRNSKSWEKLKSRELGGKKDYLSLAQNSESIWTEVNNMWASSGLWGKAGCPLHELLIAHRNMKSDFNPCDNQWSSKSTFLQWSSCVSLGNITLLTLWLASWQEWMTTKLKLICFSIPYWICTAGSTRGPTQVHLLCNSQPLFLPLHEQPAPSIALFRSLQVKTSTHPYLCENLVLHPYFTKETFLNILFQKHNANKRDESIYLGSLEKS